MGFPHALFLKQKSVKAYDCALCLEVVEEPTLCQSGHTCVAYCVSCCGAVRRQCIFIRSALTRGRTRAPRACRSFCRACILSALARKEECPLDRKQLKAAELVPNLMVAAYLADLPVRCPHAAAAADAAAQEDGAELGGEACVWTGELSALSEHLCSECSAQTVACPHAAAGCDATFRRRDAGAHAAVCAHELVACAVAGCAGCVARGAMHAHMRDAAEEHVSLLLRRAEAAERRADDAERRNAALQAQMAAAQVSDVQLPAQHDAPPLPLPAHALAVAAASAAAPPPLTSPLPPPTCVLQLQAQPPPPLPAAALQLRRALWCALQHALGAPTDVGTSAVAGAGDVLLWASYRLTPTPLAHEEGGPQLLLQVSLPWDRFPELPPLLELWRHVGAGWEPHGQGFGIDDAFGQAGGGTASRQRTARAMAWEPAWSAQQMAARLAEHAAARAAAVASH
jgi:hypothetical protein